MTDFNLPFRLQVLHTFLQPVDASSVKANELQRSPIFNKFHLDDVVSDGQEVSCRVEEVGAEEQKEDEKKDESSPVKVRKCQVNIHVQYEYDTCTCTMIMIRPNCN